MVAAFMALPSQYIIRATAGPATTPTALPATMVAAGTSTISTPVFPATLRETSAPAQEATRAPTGSPTAAAGPEKVPAPTAPAIREEKIPRGGAPTAKATPAPMAGPIRSWATRPKCSRWGRESSCPHCRRIRPMMREEKRPRAIPFETLIRYPRRGEDAVPAIGPLPLQVSCHL